MDKYYVSITVYDKGNEPYQISCTESQLSLAEAQEKLDWYKRNFNWISAWIDRFDSDGNKSIMHHETNLNVFGIRRPKQYHVTLSRWQYNNSNMEITKESEICRLRGKFDTIREAFAWINEQRNCNDMAKYSPIHINDIEYL